MKCVIVCEEGEEADRGSGEVWKRNRRHKKRHCKCEKMGVHSTTELLTIAGMHSTHSCSGKDMGGSCTTKVRRPKFTPLEDTELITKNTDFYVRD